MEKKVGCVQRAGIVAPFKINRDAIVQILTEEFGVQERNIRSWAYQTTSNEVEGFGALVVALQLSQPC